MHPPSQSTTSFALLLAVLFGAAYTFQVALAQKPDGSKTEQPPIVIERQGSFYYGYQMITAPGTYDAAQSISDHTGETFSINQRYVFFQIPPNAREYPLVMVHGGGQTGKTYEDSRDHEGFQSIFLRRGWSVYIPDFLNRARAGLTSFGGALGQLAGEQIGPSETGRYGLKAAFNMFRLGYWTDKPQFYPGVQFPQTQYALDQLAAGTIAGVADDGGAVSDNLAALMGEVGPAVLITHSQSGVFGWFTAIKSENVKAVITFEPGSFVFPKGEAPSVPKSTGSIPNMILPASEIPVEEFEKLTRIPILIVFGDYIPKTPDAPADNPWQEFWRQFPERARQFVAVFKRHGGDAEILHLPDVGVHGNTHWAFGEPNNEAMADQYSKWLQRKALDKRPR